MGEGGRFRGDLEKAVVAITDWHLPLSPAPDLFIPALYVSACQPREKEKLVQDAVCSPFTDISGQRQVP